eukprot:TRINITY_DN6080_c0_g1_i1.p2 TRINITY_DN6080_c0_g1~~TRINITY_DN6080_c0_g1_i1.p2  ORF type:complete len:127 (+),score=37.91 TRINITY_DN6080_c0_g1_i1:288-668(+)
MGMLDSVHVMASNLLMGGGSGAAEAPEPRYTFKDGRWVHETWDPNTGTWVSEDTAAADAREAELSKAYASSTPVAAAAPPPPMGSSAGPPMGAAASGQRYYGTAAANRYVDIMSPQHQQPPASHMY